MKWLESHYFLGVGALQWITGIIIIASAVILGRLFIKLSKNVFKKLAAQTKTRFDDILVDELEEPIAFSIVLAGLYWAEHIITKIDQIALKAAYPTKWKFWETRINNVENVLDNVFIFLFIVNVAWLIARVLDSIILEYVMPRVERSETSADNQILPLVRKALRGIIWTVGIVMGLDNAGLDITGAIAGLGIGGLALALAAQDTVKNFFGGIMIFLDKPFRLRDRIKIIGYDGFVEEIGIRSTRIRTLEGRLVTIPNSTFSESAVENVTAEPGRKVKLQLGLTYDTPPEKMELALQILKDIITDHQDIVADENIISFDTFGDFSLGIMFIYYIRKEVDIFESQSVISLAILKSFNEAELEFAFPTQTIYKIDQ